MEATATDRIDADQPGVRGIDAYAAIVDQLQHTVMQLVRATLEHARSDSGLAHARPLAALPDAVRPLAALPDAVRPLAALPDALRAMAARPESLRPMPSLPLAPSTPAACALSQREREVLQRIAAGDSNKMIARALSLSPHTVKRHVANILDKLGARSRSQAAAWLQRTH